MSFKNGIYKNNTIRINIIGSEYYSYNELRNNSQKEDELKKHIVETFAKLCTERKPESYFKLLEDSELFFNALALEPLIDNITGDEYVLMDFDSDLNEKKYHLRDSELYNTICVSGGLQVRDNNKHYTNTNIRITKCMYFKMIFMSVKNILKTLY
jgi:hypothetical protein